MVFTALKRQFFHKEKLTSSFKTNPHQPQLPNKPRYFASVDGLRLFAAINVILFHYEKIGGFYDLNGYPGWFFKIIKGPAFHASLFFILGGFIFMFKCSKDAELFSTRQFLKSRFRDLYPLHLMTTLSMIPLLFFISTPDQQISPEKLFYSIFMHLSMLWSFSPLQTYDLNTPSWAISAFFLCYLLFGPLMRFMLRLRRAKTIVSVFTGILVLQLLWALLFRQIGYNEKFYLLFHIFAPARVLEFMLGMLIARFLQVPSTIRFTIEKYLKNPAANDCAIFITGAILYATLWFQIQESLFFQWCGYHIIQPFLYCILVMCFAQGTGIVCKICSWKEIRRLGKSSFYPYLLHIPLISWICYILTVLFGYTDFTHSTVNILLTLSLMYGMSLIYVSVFRKRKPTCFVKTRRGSMQIKQVTG